MNIKGNLGLYAEEIINRTCEYYKDKKIAHIEKREIPMKIIKQINESVVLCKLMSKSYVDYFGSYMGKHLEFEVKQTSEQNFNTSIIKSHQWDYLDHCINFQIIKPFLIIYFNKYEKFYLINFDWMNKQLLKQKTKTIKYEIIESECIPLGIVFPGIIDFIKKI